MNVKTKNGVTTIRFDAEERRAVAKFLGIVESLKTHADDQWKGAATVILAGVDEIQKAFCADPEPKASPQKELPLK